MLCNAKNILPNAHFLIGDFDLLRESYSAREGKLAPVVSTKLEASYEKKDYNDYLVPKGAADIFFPTNFFYLNEIYNKVI